MITVIDREGAKKTLEYAEGDNLMELLRDAGYDEIEAICGGSCSCATCHVHIQSTVELDAMEENEELLLELADGYSEQYSRLSCQISLSQDLGDLIVTIPPED